MIIPLPQPLPTSFTPGNSIRQDIMRSLDMKTLFNFCVWSEDEIEEDCGRDEEGEGEI